MLEQQKRFQRKLKLSQTREEVQHNTLSTFSPARPQGECWPRQDSGTFLPENRRNKPRQSEQYPIPKESEPKQRWTLKLHIGYK